MTDSIAKILIFLMAIGLLTAALWFESELFALTGIGWAILAMVTREP